MGEVFCVRTCLTLPFSTVESPLFGVVGCIDGRAWNLPIEFAFLHIVSSLSFLLYMLGFNLLHMCLISFMHVLLNGVCVCGLGWV